MDEKKLIYEIEDSPPPASAFFGALQHVLASFVGIITPTLIIGGVLGLGAEIPYLISMALFVSGLATFIQAKRFGPVGAGMLVVQGTSFAFLGSLIAAGFIAKGNGGGPKEIISLMVGVCFVGAFIEIFLSQFLDKLRRILTPTVTGIVITTIGFTLIRAGMNDVAGGVGAKDFGGLHHIGLASIVLISVVILSLLKNPLIRLSAIFISMVIGYIIASVFGYVNFAKIGAGDLFAIPIPFKYGFDFNLAAFIPIAFIYLITAIESVGDLTGICSMSNHPIKGEQYKKRIKGGILADGVNSLIAATFNTFPNTTFSQNVGVIQITSNASRKVGFYVAGILVVLGLFPVIGSILQTMPKPVLGGATLILFGTVAAAGIRILASTPIDRKKMIIMAASFGLGFGVAFVPDVLKSTPDIIQKIFSSSITTAGVTAIILSIFIPEKVEE